MLIEGIAGAISGIVTRLITNPFDVLKIRFQLQEEPVMMNQIQNHGSKYRGLLHAVKLIYQEEGILAFWKGGLSGMFLYVGFGFVQFASLPLFLNIFTTSTSNSTTDGRSSYAISGAAASVTAEIISYPFDIVRTRLVAQRHTEHHKGIFDAINDIWKNTGVRGMYRGLIPSLLSIAPNSVIVFGSYEYLVKYFNLKVSADIAITDNDENKNKNKNNDKNNDKNNLKLINHPLYNSMMIGMCGLVAGLTGKMAVMPFDTVKKRLQSHGLRRHQSFGKSHDYQGLLHCFEHIFKNEGIAGFYKGGVPMLLKTSFGTAATFITYEAVRSLEKK